MTRPIAYLALLLAPIAARAGDLQDYVARPDASYRHRTVARGTHGAGGRSLCIELTSQTWRQTTWKHWLRIYRPKTLRHPDAAMLMITGGDIGRPAPGLSDGTSLYLGAIADRAGCLVALLQQVPNQPLLGGLHEDALIAMTFDGFLRTGESDWPLLMPMVKAAARAIDTIDAASRAEWSQPIARVCVTGASKRGWTTWLVAACDQRVAAIAPLVIDTLNFKAQLPHQLQAWGKLSEKIHDYTSRQLHQKMVSAPRAPQLLQIVDPWCHRRRLTIPKLIVNGTNDRYWPVDAATVYFADLPGERALHYVPNAGHGLNMAAVEPVERFFGLVLADKPRPRLTWRVLERDDAVTLSVLADQPVSSATLWRASSATRDFRDSSWTSAPLAARDHGGYLARMPRPAAADAHGAMYIEMRFATPTGELSLASRMVVVGRE